MMEKQVIIFVRGEQYYDGADPDDVELISEGTMTIADDGEIVLSYQESELTGMEGTTTQFAIRGVTVVLTRSGGVNAQMVFQRGTQHSSLYETAWGTLVVDIATSRLVHRLDEHGGILEIQYTIAVEHQVTGRSQFKIRVREKMR